MPGHPAERQYDIAEFLAWEGEADVHYELVDGRIVAMAPPSFEHGQIVLRVGRRLLNGLVPPCVPVSQAGLLIPDRDDCFYEADLAATCTEQKRGARYLESPTLIVEVLSQSTRTHDRGNKAPDYATIPSVQEILLIDSQKRWVQLWTRQADAWVVRDWIGEGAVKLAALRGDALTLDEIYEGVL